MPVGAPQRHFASAPGLIGRWLQYLRLLSDSASMEGVNGIDRDIGNVAVVAERRGGRHVRATPEREGHGSCRAEGPVPRVGVASLTSEHTAEPVRRSVEVVHGQYRVRAGELHGRSLHELSTEATDRTESAGRPEPVPAGRSSCVSESASWLLQCRRTPRLVPNRHKDAAARSLKKAETRWLLVRSRVALTLLRLRR